MKLATYNLQSYIGVSMEIIESGKIKNNSNNNIKH